MAQNTTLNSELFVPVLAAAQFAAYENSVARAIVNTYDLPMNAGKTVSIPVWDSVGAQIITDESAAVKSTTDTNSKSITLTEHVVYHTVTDMLRDSASNNVLADLGEQSGRAIAESFDSQVFNLFNGFTTGLGTTKVALTVESIMKAAAILRSRKLTGPFYAVVRPEQAFDIKVQLANAGGSTIPSLSDEGNRVLNQYFIGSISGVTILESALLNVDAEDDAVGAVFAPSAIGHAMRGTVVMEEQRQAAARATDLVLTGVAGADIIRLERGIKLLGKSAL